MPASSSHEFGNQGPPARIAFSSASSSLRMSQISSSLRFRLSDGGARAASAVAGVADVKKPAGATARLQIAHRNQPVVGFDHGEAADLVGICEVADRRQFGAGPQMPILDLSHDAGDDLVAERLVAILTDGEGKHSDSPPLRIGRSMDQYSHGN
jgi:hypothetical protein